MKTTNKYISGVVGWYLKKTGKLKGYSFAYEHFYHDSDIIDSQAKKQFVVELREKVEEYIAELQSEGEGK